MSWRENLTTQDQFVASSMHQSNLETRTSVMANKQCALNHIHTGYTLTLNNSPFLNNINL